LNHQREWTWWRQIRYGRRWGISLIRDHEAAVDQLKGKANALRVEKTAHGVPTADPIGVRLTPLTALTAIRILFSLLLFFSLKIKN